MAKSHSKIQLELFYEVLLDYQLWIDVPFAKGKYTVAPNKAGACGDANQSFHLITENNPDAVDSDSSIIYTISWSIVSVRLKTCILTIHPVWNVCLLKKQLLNDFFIMYIHFFGFWIRKKFTKTTFISHKRKGIGKRGHKIVTPRSIILIVLVIKITIHCIMRKLVFTFY